MALIAAQAEKATAAISGKEGCMRAHDSHIARPRRADPKAHAQRIDRAQRRIGEVPRLARNHIYERLAPRPAEASRIAVADETGCYGENV